MADLDRLLATDVYRGHVAFNDAFLTRHGEAMADYRRRWEFDPFKLWSRRYEYPYVAAQIVDHLNRHGGGSTTRLLDAGSGVTYLPHYLCSKLPALEVVCADYDGSYVPMFKAINRTEGHERVQFAEADMRKLPFDAASFDALACVSVLEHTDQYAKILDEFARVLRPGGLLALTFDLSIDDRFELSRKQATDLLEHLGKGFEPTTDAPAHADELKKLDMAGPLLSTDNIKRTQPELLPWRHPMLKAVHDLVKGHGWTGGFRSKSVYCIAAHRRP